MPKPRSSISGFGFRPSFGARISGFGFGPLRSRVGGTVQIRPRAAVPQDSPLTGGSSLIACAHEMR
jgi:hypothetical protein